MGEISIKVSDGNIYTIEDLDVDVKAAKKVNYTNVFNDLWIQYERKGSKKEAFHQFLKIGPSEYNKISKAIDRYFLEFPDKQFRKDFQRFLKYDLYVQYYDLWEEEQTTQEKNMNIKSKYDLEWWGD